MRQSKFGVGSSVYLIYPIEKGTKDKADVVYYVHPDILAVSRVSVDEYGFHYSLIDSNEDIIDWCYEDNVFSTYKDAEREMEKRNKSLREA